MPTKQPQTTTPTEGIKIGLREIDETVELHTRWPTLERHCPPFSARYWVIGGRPGNYKTQLMVNLATDMATEKQRVLVVSLEETAGAIMMQIVARLSGLSRRRIMDLRKGGAASPAERAAVERALCEARALEQYLCIHETRAGGRNVRDVLLSILRDPFDAVFVDHLGMFGKRTLDDLLYALDQMRGLTRGELLSCVRPFVCVASPLNRGVEQGSDEEVKKRQPRLADFRGSSFIEHDVDVAIILRKKTDTETETEADAIDAYVLKNRDGRAPLKLRFWGNGACATVTERAPLKAQEQKEPQQIPMHWQEKAEEHRGDNR